MCVCLGGGGEIMMIIPVSVLYIYFPKNKTFFSGRQLVASNALAGDG